MRIRLIFLAILAIAQTACSTPPAIEREATPEETWDAYISCIQYHFGANQRVCDDVSTMNAYSYNQYFFHTGGYGPVYGGGRLRGAVAGLRPYLDQAYKDYLAALPPADRAALAEQWRALVPEKE